MQNTGSNNSLNLCQIATLSKLVADCPLRHLFKYNIYLLDLPQRITAMEQEVLALRTRIDADNTFTDLSPSGSRTNSDKNLIFDQATFELQLILSANDAENYLQTHQNTLTQETKVRAHLQMKQTFLQLGNHVKACMHALHAYYYAPCDTDRNTILNYIQTAIAPNFDQNQYTQFVDEILHAADVFNESHHMPDLSSIITLETFCGLLLDNDGRVLLKECFRLREQFIPLLAKQQALQQEITTLQEKAQRKQTRSPDLFPPTSTFSSPIPFFAMGSPQQTQTLTNSRAASPR